MEHHSLPFPLTKIVSNLIKNSEVQKIKDQFNGIKNEKEKIGIPLGINCINPITDEPILLYIANFVLDNYGEGNFGVLLMMNVILNSPKNINYQ